MVLCSAVLVWVWVQSESPAQHPTDVTDRAAAQAYVNEYRDYLDTQPVVTLILERVIPRSTRHAARPILKCCANGGVG